MPEQGIRSTYSKIPFQIHMCDDHGVISTGSAFFYALDEDWFLITTWHNVSGQHSFVDKILDEDRRTPTFIKAKLASVTSSSGAFTTVARRVEIYNNFQPLWFENPELSSTCDVVALPFDRPRDCPSFMHPAANRIRSPRIPLLPGCTVFIIGFPSSISVNIGLPLWKSGYIASEPHFDVTIGGEVSDVGGLSNGIYLPAFFIDSQTRQGMSGSPVFASYTGTWDSESPYSNLNDRPPEHLLSADVMIGSTANEFVGCYSARIGRKEEGAALGLCWRKDVIEHICASRKVGAHPHFI